MESRKKPAFQNLIPLTISSVALYILGRSIFSVWDTNNQAMGARYWAETGRAWMAVWPGLDLLIGIPTRLTRDSSLAITICGAFFNAFATVLVFQSCLRIGVRKHTAFIAATATSLWFLPHLGGWIGDNISYLLGITPAFSLILLPKRRRTVFFVILGTCAAAGLTTKMNSFVPSFAIGLFFSCAAYRAATDPPGKLPWKKCLGITVLCFSITALTINSLITTDIGIYNSIANAYLEIKSSNVTGQVSLSRYILIPLGVDFIKAAVSGNYGVLIFVPLAVLFWIATAWSLSNILNSDRRTRIRHLFALLLLLSSAAVCVGLGRGLTHRLLLLPAGIIISFNDILKEDRNIRIAESVLLAYLIATWMLFAYKQSPLNISKVYDTRGITNGPKKQFCIAATKKIAEMEENHDRLIGLGAPGAQISNGFTCWENNAVRLLFSGTGDVQEVGNSLNIIFSNQKSINWVLREKWFSRQATPKGRKKWIEQEVSEIERLRSPFYFERIRLTSEEAASPDYDKEWENDRLNQRAEIARRLGASEIGRINSTTIWKTKWSTSQKISGNDIPKKLDTL